MYRPCRNLDAAVPPQLRLDWSAQCKDAAPPPGSIQRFFKRRAGGDGAAADPDGMAGTGPLTSLTDARAAAAQGVAAAHKRQRQGGGGGASGGSARAAKAGGSGSSGGGILRFLKPPAPA